VADDTQHRVDDVILQHTIETTQLKDGGKACSVNRVKRGIGITKGHVNSINTN
jgi:hypothetical protein